MVVDNKEFVSVWFTVISNECKYKIFRNSVLSDIEADLISDYTTALQLEPQWTNHGNIDMKYVNSKNYNTSWLVEI